MANPYERYLGKEDHLQHQVINWLKYKYPKVRYHHSPNEGKRSKFEQFKYKFLGSDSGFPDLIIFIGNKFFVVELKIKPNKPSPSQIDWLSFFESMGVPIKVAYDFDEAVNFIENSIKSFLKLEVV